MEFLICFSTRSCLWEHDGSCQHGREKQRLSRGWHAPRLCFPVVSLVAFPLLLLRADEGALNRGK